MDTAWNILDQEEAQLSLGERDARLVALSSNLPEVMFYQLDTGQDGQQRRFTYVSAGVEELHEVTAAQVLDDANVIYNQFVKEDRARVAESEILAIKSLSTFKAEVRVRMPSGKERWRYIISAPRRLQNNHLAWDGVEIDIDDLMKAKETAEAVNRSKSEFLDNMSHELRTPLNGVMGMLQLMQATTLDTEQTEYAKTAIQACQRLTRLVSNILDLFRIEADRLEFKNDLFALLETMSTLEGIFLSAARQKELVLTADIARTCPIFSSGMRLMSCKCSTIS